ncbi:MAG: toll/interleukin-1 receptor domain-containing protein [Candidatus Binatia bacterium]
MNKTRLDLPLESGVLRIMADSEHVMLVRQGEVAFREWRVRNAMTRVDLSRADLSALDLHWLNLCSTERCRSTLMQAKLSEANLSTANLRGVFLIEADLTGADLSGANLERCYLTRADLTPAEAAPQHFHKNLPVEAKPTRLVGANLQQADLRGARLCEADLRGADLRGADLSWADLRGATLDDADLSNACCAGTGFGGLDLSTARGLETVRHFGPSHIGTDTLFRSIGIPDVFLRGCGLRDWEIEAAKLYDPEVSANDIVDIQQRVFNLRTGSPIQIGSLFISYVHADGAFVDALEGKLDEKGIRFWRDVHHATAGRLDEIVDRAIRLNPTVVLVLSKKSIESRWVEYEANLADKLSQELGRDTLCPIALDDAWKKCRWSGKLRTQIEKYNILSFTDWKDAQRFGGMFRRLVEGLLIFYQPGKGST